MRPPPGKHPLPKEFIAQHQRARIISALAEETVEKGYRAVTVADIVRRAGIARNTFYENFSSKEDCFLAASEFAVKEALRRVVDAASKVDSWPARVNSGLSAFLHYVASEPALARTCIVEALSAGPAAVERYERSIQAFVPLFRMGRKVSATARSCRAPSRRRSSAASSGSSTSASSWDRRSRSRSCCRSWSSSRSPLTSAPRQRSGRRPSNLRPPAAEFEKAGIGGPMT